MSEKVENIVPEESEWAENGGDWSDEFSDCSGDGSEPVLSSKNNGDIDYRVSKTTRKVLTDSKRINVTRPVDIPETPLGPDTE